MNIYFLNLGFVFFGSILASLYRKENLLDPNQNKPNKLLVFAVITSLVLVSGLRYGVGTDFYTYQRIYIRAGSYNSILEIISSNIEEKGFTIFNWLLNQISPNPQIMFFVAALITNLFVVITLYKYAKPFELGMFLYICTFSYYTTFNIVRQCMVAAVLFWAVRYIISGEWRKYFLITIICSLFHNSAILMIPAYFIARRKAWSPITIIIIVGSIFVSYMFTSILPVLMDILSSTPYSEYDEWFNTRDKGMNFLRLLVMTIPLILSYIFREKLQKMWPESNCIVNLCIISLAIGFIALQNLIFARLVIFFSFYQIILITYLTTLFDNKTNRLMYYLIVISYFLYSYFLLPRDGNVLPYKTFFS